jgi:Tfp pilus assembly protein PilN
MLRYHLNLATNPFVNYRKYYLIGVALLVLGLSGAGYSVNRYLALRRGNSALVQELHLKQQDLIRLTTRSAELKEQLEQPQTLDAIDRISFYNLLIQRDTFPWTQFFQDLEAVIPFNVQVTQIRQKSSGQVTDLEMVFMGHSTVDAVNFLRNLTNSKKFHNIYVDQEGSFRDAATHRVSNDVEVTLHMQYEP